MKALFTDNTKSSVLIEFTSHKTIVPYENILEVRDSLSALINERQQMDDAAKAKVAALAKANAALSKVSPATIVKPVASPATAMVLKPKEQKAEDKKAL